MTGQLDLFSVCGQCGGPPDHTHTYYAVEQCSYNDVIIQGNCNTQWSEIQKASFESFLQKYLNREFR